ncbi:MAG: Ni/Fe-hydrogenase cytochrome b subunit [Acidobacteria bacterium]|nr:Ni/Fe-hydrogenase cytochrome b subunit [Acidobacteriota bacterium]
MTAEPRPVDRCFWTPGVWMLTALMAAAALTLILRFAFGLGMVTNLDNAHPWGIWIGIDVAAGVALAAGGFTTAFLGHILGRHYYEPVTRPALLTAALGYTMVAFAVFVDLGRSWAIWKFLVFQNHRSVLFEVGICVMTYLLVLWIELLPAVAARLGRRVRLLGWIDRGVRKTMGAFIILGVVLSCCHQSSLGSLMVIAPTKLHPLWYTPWLPLHFLLSAIAVGFPMVVVETGLATRSLHLDSEMPVLVPLSRLAAAALGVALVVRLGDFVARESHLFIDGSGASISLLVELVLGGVLPLIMLLIPAVRRSRGGLFVAAALVVLGVLINRINVFVVALSPPFAEHAYVPAAGELIITAGSVAALMFLYRAAVTYLPILSARKLEEVH